MKWGEEMIGDQSGKVAIVTGSNTGIGFHMVRALASKGATVIMACRDAEKAEVAMRRLQGDVTYLKIEKQLSN